MGVGGSEGRRRVDEAMEFWEIGRSVRRKDSVVHGEQQHSMVRVSIVRSDDTNGTTTWKESYGSNKNTITMLRQSI